jgi:hypothetical protein
VAGQTANSTYYCEVLQWLHENVRDFNPNLCNKRTGCWIMTVHHLTLPISRGNFLLQSWLSSPIHPTCLTLPPATFLCSPIEHTAMWTQLRCSRQNCRQWWTPRRLRLPRCIKNWHKCWERCICMEGDYFMGDGGQLGQS